MRVFVECAPDNGMARFASIVAYEAIGLLILSFRGENARADN
jgi:hypothetical protein